MKFKEKVKSFSYCVYAMKARQSPGSASLYAGELS